MDLSPGDYIKVEFHDDESGEGELMWVRIEWCDSERQLVFGRVDSIPVLSHRGKLTLGSQLVVR